MPISSQDVMQMYNPIIASLDEGAYKDKQASDANINFDKRVARASYPITRMFTPGGKVNHAAITNATPYEDASQMWENLNADMPQGRGMDSVVFQQKHAAGKQIYDMNLVNQLDLMRKSGMSEKKIKSQFDVNPELRQYMYENSILEPPTRGMSFGKSLAIGGAGYGALKAAQMAAPIPNYVINNAQEALKGEGLKYSKRYGSIVRMNDKELIKQFMDEGMSNKDAKIESKKVRDKLAKGKKSFWGKQALKPGSAGMRPSQIGKRIGTRWVLGNVGKTVGSKAGTGLLAWLGRAAMGSNPYGIAANAALFAAPWIWGMLTDKDKQASDSSMWR